MAGSESPLLADILEQHLEEFEFLWDQRRDAVHSPRYTVRELSELEDRIEAHVQGLLVGEEQAAALLRPALTGDEPGPAFVAAYVLSRRSGVDVSSEVMNAFVHAKGGGLAGLREALCHLPIDSHLTPLRQIMSGRTPVSTAVWAAAAEVLGFHGRLELKSKEVDRLLGDDEPEVRLSGWRAVAYTIPPPAETYQAGFRDEAPAVRRAALLAAAWGRQPWLVGHCRQAAGKPSAADADAAWLLAVLGRPAELGFVVSLARAAELGPQRYRALGVFGHPGVVEEVLAGMENADPKTAAAAGVAFTKITGFAVESNRRVAARPADGHEPDEFEREFLDEVRVPDVGLARSHWQKVKGEFSKGTRWCRGSDLGRGATPAVLAQLDLESRREACLRGKYEGSWQGSPASLEVYPQPRD